MAFEESVYEYNECYLVDLIVVQSKFNCQYVKYGCKSFRHERNMQFEATKCNSINIFANIIHICKYSDMLANICK